MPLERSGNGKLTLDGWEKLNTKIEELVKQGCRHSEIAKKMGMSKSTLTTLKKEKAEFHGNLGTLKDIFTMSGLGEPGEGVDYTPLFREQMSRIRTSKEKQLPTEETRQQNKFPLPYELQCFRGREQELQTLRDCFMKGERKQGIAGLGGIGKTQLALKYALEFQDKYKPVFWVHAETEESIRGGYEIYARRLGLIEDEVREQEKAVAATLRWFETNSGWLLVMDNADTPQSLRNYLPRNANGHVLLTTRAHTLACLNINALLPLEPLSEQASLEFFLAKCNRPHASAGERRAAAKLAKELGHLPLAMAHAAAYITHNVTTFAHYLALYRERNLALLDDESIPGLEEYLKPVRTTWDLNLRALEQDLGPGRPGTYTREMLKFCAFVGADDIPSELILSGAKEYCPPLYELIAKPQDNSANTEKGVFCDVEDEEVYHELLQPLVQYSLVTKSLEALPRFSIHRVLQMVIADRLGSERRAWQERAVRAVDSAFPIPEVKNWRLCERLLPHALVVGEMIKQEGLTTQAAGRLLCHLGEFLSELGRYDLAEAHARFAQDIREQYFSDCPLDIAESLQSLGNICHYQKKFEEAEALFDRALAIQRQNPPCDDRKILQLLNDKAALYNGQGHWKEAEDTYVGLLDSAEEVFKGDANLAYFYHNLGWSNYGQGQYEEAGRWYNKALAYWEISPEDSHPMIASSLHDVAQTYRKQGRFAEATHFYARSLRIQKKVYRGNHPFTAILFFNIARLYQATKPYVKAEKYYKRALTMDREQYGEDHPDVVTDLEALAELYQLMGKQEDANALLRQRDAILKATQEPGTES